MRLRLVQVAIVLSVLVTIVFAATWTISFLKQVVGIPHEAYASDWTAAFVIDHVRSTGEWPKNWDDLRDEYDRLAVPAHYAWTFEELQMLVKVDWNTDVSQIRLSKTPVVLIRLTSGRRVSFNGDPNQLIYDFVNTGNDPNQIHSRIGGPE